MELKSVPTEALLLELQTRNAHGVAALSSKESGRVEVWWGDRTKCLGLASRLSYNVQTEMDDIEDSEDDSPEDEAEEGLDELALEFPQIGQYL